MNEPARSVLLIIARLLLSPIFIASGAMKIMNWAETAEHMAKEGMVAVPFFLAGAIVVELGAGIGVLVGCCTRLSALVLAAFLIPTSVIFHDFWVYEGMAQMNQMQHFMKNMTIIGGLLALAVAGAGRYSVASRTSQQAQSPVAPVRHDT